MASQPALVVRRRGALPEVWEGVSRVSASDYAPRTALNGFELYPKSRDTAPVRTPDVIRRKKTPKRPRRPSSTLEVPQSPRSARGATPHNYGYAGMYLTFLGAGLNGSLDGGLGRTPSDRLAPRNATVAPECGRRRYWRDAPIVVARRRRDDKLSRQGGVSTRSTASSGA